MLCKIPGLTVYIFAVFCCRLFRLHAVFSFSYNLPLVQFFKRIHVCFLIFSGDLAKKINKKYAGHFT